ncbi:MAG: ABC transporter ATP-binding protein [Candidatus Methanofastidiosia archaeon]
MTHLIEVERLKKYFPIKGGVFSRVIGYVHAVDDISFYIEKGETLGMVGESGCGKTTVGRTILRLVEPTEGKIYFEGKDLGNLDNETLRIMRRNMQMVFQDPFSSLNPRMTIKNIVGEPFVIQNLYNGKELKERVLELLDTVGLKPEHLNRYPHEFSGGQRQRICVARALALNPKFIVLDEPTSALDVSVQAQVLNMLQDLQRNMNLTYLFISHNLSIIKHISDIVAVMYVGKIVEMCGVDELFSNHLHPYTKALLSAIPNPDPDFQQEEIILKGDVPSPSNPPPGCRFHPRCPFAQKVCTKEEPKLLEEVNRHFVACHFRGLW